MTCLAEGNLDLRATLSTGKFPVGQHIEIYGAPGTGKTAFCLHWAVQFLKRDCKTRIGWIDTVGSFPIRRLSQMCDEESILKRFVLLRAFSLEEVHDAVNTITDHNVSLLVIDNVSVPFRTLWTDSLSERVDAIRSLGLHLRHSDLSHQRTFIYISHLTTRFLELERSILVPSLGENWAVMCDIEFLVEQSQRRRSLTLVRSDLVDFDSREILFQITVSQLWGREPSQLTRIAG